jgi:hypothetical protein
LFNSLKLSAVAYLNPISHRRTQTHTDKGSFFLSLGDRKKGGIKKSKVKIAAPQFGLFPHPKNSLKIFPLLYPTVFTDELVRGNGFLPACGGLRRSAANYRFTE